MDSQPQPEHADGNGHTDSKDNEGLLPSGFLKHLQPQYHEQVAAGQQTYNKGTCYDSRPPAITVISSRSYLAAFSSFRDWKKEAMLARNMTIAMMAGKKPG